MGLITFTKALGLLSAGVSITQAAATYQNGSTINNGSETWSWIDPEHFKVAAVRQPPVGFPLPVGVNHNLWTSLDVNGTIDLAVKQIQKAGAEGVNLIAFPELYFPGFPVALNYLNYTPTDIAYYVNQSITFDGPEYKRLTSAVKAAGLFAVLSFSERTDNAIYISQTLVDPNGATIHHHRKLRPSGAERNVFSDGETSSLKVIPTSYGRIGTLLCWEHLHQTMSFPMHAQAEQIHVASFPYVGGDDYTGIPWWDRAETSTSIPRVYSIDGYVFTVMPAIGRATIFGAGGVPLNVSDAVSDFESLPYITATVNASAFNLTETYDVDGEFSWAALSQIRDAYPAYIPRVASKFFEHLVNPIKVITTRIVKNIGT